MDIQIPTGKAKVIIKAENGTKLARLRARTGKSLEKTVRALNIQGLECSLASLIRWENGTPLKLDTARSLASYYGVKIDEVVG